MNQIFFYAEIAIAIILIILVAVQQRGTALGSAFGGGGEHFASRRGIQKKLHYATMVAAALFIILSILGIAL